MYTCIECLTMTIKPKRDNNISVVNIHRRADTEYDFQTQYCCFPLPPPPPQTKEKKVVWVKGDTKSKLAGSLTECLKFRKLVLSLKLDIVTISKHLGYFFSIHSLITSIVFHWKNVCLQRQESTLF